MVKHVRQLCIKNGNNKVTIPEGMFRYIQGFRILALPKGKKIEIRRGNFETGIVIFSGICDIMVEGKTYAGIGCRHSVFAGPPTSVYVPFGTSCTIISQEVEIGVCFSKCEKKTEFAIIKPEAVKVMQVGRDNWQREVRIAIGQDSPSVNMIVGETINPAGNWSGTPPHKHEKTDLPRESFHEELYYFKTEKPQGFGIEKFYSPQRGVDELLPLKNNSVTFMPWGYHQIVAGPGYNLYYLFFLAGEGKQLIGFVDSEHKWILE